MHDRNWPTRLVQDMVICWVMPVFADARIDAEICQAGSGSLQLHARVGGRAAPHSSGATRAGLLARYQPLSTGHNKQAEAGTHGVRKVARCGSRFGYAV